MKVLVTGGAGYLGTVLVNKLLRKGYKVTVLDNLLFGNYLGKHKNMKIIDGDIRNLVTVVKALNDADAVIHLASIVGDQAGDLEQRTTIEINYLATKNIAELCQLYGKRFIYPSTCSVYGERSEKVVKENARLIKPISLYGQTKLRSEQGIADSCNDYTILRLGTLFGLSPRMRFDLAINLFAAKAINKEG